MADLTNDTLTAWLAQEGFRHVTEHDAGDDMPATDEYWIREPLSENEPSYLVSQDTAIHGRWRISTAAAGAGEWADMATDLTAGEAYELMLAPIGEG